jgi:hypothetical protein
MTQRAEAEGMIRSLEQQLVLSSSSITGQTMRAA